MDHWKWCFTKTFPPANDNSVEFLIAAKSPLHNTGNFHVVKTGGYSYETCS
jgi:hypothetical protein